jgi:ribonucleoside-diphosphate reductase alpha chain
MVFFLSLVKKKNLKKYQIMELQKEKKQTKKEENLQIFSRDQVFKACLEYFEGDELAAQVWINKYALKDSAGNIYEMTPDDMHKRIAKEFARIEEKYPNPLSEEEIFDLIKRFKYIVPQGSPMAGIGNNFQYVSISNCFVIGNPGEGDSYGGILKLDQELVQLQKRRAGVGLDLSFIRPKGTSVKNSALTSTGVVPYMERFSNSTREVAQDGRRGALMESFSVVHPDAEDFIDAKMDPTKVTGANVSVRISDSFMDSALSETPFTAKFPVDSENPTFTKEINATNLWKKIVHNAWQRAEPGILFWDTIIRESIPDCYADLGFKTISTNPCGEITLCADDSCRLLCLNLYSYVENPFTSEAYFNWDLFKKHAVIAQRLMDDLIDLEIEKVDKILEKIDTDPEDEFLKLTEKNLWTNIKNKCIKGRRTGLGVTAEGDMVAALGITYGTDTANDVTEEVHKQLKLSAYRSSVNMAKERGAFPIYEVIREGNNPFINRIKDEDIELYSDMMKYGRRNIALLTIAPTGSVSIMTQTTSGIEPAFLISYMRRRKINPNDKDARVDFVDQVGDSWQNYPVFHHKFIDYLRAKGYEKSHIENLSESEIKKLIEESPYYKATSNDVNWVKKVEMQGRIQKHVDHSISVTVNLPNEITEEMVGKVYETGWRSGCKGITVYRDGSRSGVLISEETKKEEEKKKLFEDNHAPKRPKFLDAQVHRFMNKGEKWIAFVGLLEGRPYEIFTGLEDAFRIPKNVENGQIRRLKIDETSRYDFIINPKSDDVMVIEGLSNAFDVTYHNYAKMISGILRHGMPLEYVVEMVEKLNLDEERLDTWKSGIIRTIKKYIKDGTKAKNAKCVNNDPDCALQYTEGCLSCPKCGLSKCG